MIVNGRRLEAFAAMLTGVGPYARVCAHVKGQAVRHAKGLAANLSTNKDKNSNEANEENSRKTDFHIGSFGLPRAERRRYDTH